MLKLTSLRQILACSIFMSFGMISPWLAVAEMRDFKSTSGQVLRGEFLELKGDTVLIKREDGSTVSVKANLFSPEDQVYLKNAASKVAIKKNLPKITPKDISVYAFTLSAQTQKLDEDVFDELRVTKSDRIRIAGKKERSAGRVDGRVVYHMGKMALFPVGERSGKVTAALATAEDVRFYWAVIEFADSIQSTKVPMGEAMENRWSYRVEGMDGVLEIKDADGKSIGSLKAPAKDIVGLGFAATVRWVGNEADVSFTFDE